MTFPRRRFLKFATGVFALPYVSTDANAQAFPSKAVRWIVPAAAGGSADVVARLIGQHLSSRLGQSFVIENRPGAGGHIAMEAVATAPPDGYSLYFVATPPAVSAALYGSNLRFNVVRGNIPPVAGIVHAPLTLLVHPSVPAKTLSEFIALARRKDVGLNMGSAGNGSPNHLAGELFKMMAGVEIAHVPYRGGGPALIDLLGGDLQVMFSNLPVGEHIRAGKLRALAVTTTARSDQFPDLPSIAEFVPGYEASIWFGLALHRDTSEGIVGKLRVAINEALADPSIKASLAKLDSAPFNPAPSEFAKFVSDEGDKWQKVIRAANIKAE